MTQVNESGVLITPTIQKYLDIIERGSIEEREIISLKSLMAKDKDAERLLHGKIADAPLMLSKIQNEKGIEFLLNQWETPRGTERKNNPFGYREQDALTSFQYFELTGFYDLGNANHSFYVPIYNCIGKQSSFQYYYNGEVNIIG